VSSVRGQSGRRATYTTDPPAGVVGTWRSELGSDLTFLEDAEGILRGTYRSAVGQTCAPQPLAGTCVQRADGSAVVGFVVGWPTTDSLATWTGRFEPADDRIVATWLLESGAGDATTWRATHLGCDVFHRVDGFHRVGTQPENGGRSQSEE
jgi:Avidin family